MKTVEQWLKESLPEEHFDFIQHDQVNLWIGIKNMLTDNLKQSICILDWKNFEYYNSLFSWVFGGSELPELPKQKRTVCNQETDSPDELPTFPKDDYRDAFVYATFKRDETTGEIHSTQPLEVLQPLETATSEYPLISKYRELVKHIHDLCYYQDPNLGPTVYQMIEDFNNKHEQGE